MKTNKKIDLLDKLTEEQEDKVRKLCLKENKTFLQALNKLYPVLSY